MIEICRESNYDTYGEYLTLNKIERTIGDVLAKDTDNGSMNVILGVGKGFFQDFDMAIRNDAQANGFATPLGEKMISESADGLAYGKYFNQYKTVDGHIITLKHLSFLDEGTMAEAAKQNGRVHPRTGLPITSHQAFLTKEALNNIADTTTQNIVNFYDKKVSENEVCYHCSNIENCKKKRNLKCF